MPKHLVTSTQNRGEKKITGPVKPDVETWNSLTSLSEDTCLLRSLFWDLVLVSGDDPPWGQLAAEARRC